jgi:uracil-DNA glycosylase
MQSPLRSRPSGVKNSMLDPAPRSTAPSHRQILEFYACIGVDLTLGEETIDRLAPPREREKPAPAPIAAAGTGRALPTASNAALPAFEEAALNARNLARSARDLAHLEQILTDFEGCGLKKTASRLVFADGNPAAPLMIIGEAPGREEDQSGKLFAGDAGSLLDKMLASIGLDRNSVYLANLVPWRPPGNRTPTAQEIALCLPFLLQQIELAQPKILMIMGAPACQGLLNQRESILRLRGRWFEHKNDQGEIPLLATLHPAYLLRQPAQKALAWRDLLALRAKLDLVMGDHDAAR